MQIPSKDCISPVLPMMVPTAFKHPGKGLPAPVAAKSYSEESKAYYHDAAQVLVDPMRLPRFAAQAIIGVAMLPVNLKRFRRKSHFWLHRTLCMIKVRTVGTHPRQPCAITVITPTFKRLPLLAEAIASVRAQTLQDWEQIIVADGHDPEVKVLVESFKDDRLSYIPSKSFRSVGHLQRNVGLAHSKGHFVIFLDDDNIMYPQALATMLQGFDAPEVGFVIAPVDFDETTVLAPKSDFGLGEIDTLNFMVRRQLFALVGGWRNTYQADYLIIDAIRRVARGRYLDGPSIGFHR